MQRKDSSKPKKEHETYKESQTSKSPERTLYGPSHHSSSFIHKTTTPYTHLTTTGSDYTGHGSNKKKGTNSGEKNQNVLREVNGKSNAVWNGSTNHKRAKS